MGNLTFEKWRKSKDSQKVYEHEVHIHPCGNPKGGRRVSKENKDTAILVRPIEILDGVAYIPLKASHVIKTIVVEGKNGKYKVYTLDK